jgi:uroporphyrinogen-III synthase
MRRVLVLRPEPGASATVERARERGLDAFAVPLFEVEAVDWRPPDPGAFDGLLLTSANAVRHGGKQLHELRGLPVYAVGEATAAAAREDGFKVVMTGDSGVDGLVGSIAGDLKLLHLCGLDRQSPQVRERQVTHVTVYRSTPVEMPELSAASGSIALIHSPRAGARFAELVQDRICIAIVAMSATAGAAVGEGWESVDIASHPTDDALLALAARLCNKPHPK